jgi:hypothetical protein
VAPVKSLFFSLVACMKNFGAFAIYAVGWLVLFLTIGTLFGVLGGLVGGVSMARAVMMPVALLLAAMFSTSIYFTFRDCFVESTDSSDETNAQELS